METKLTEAQQQALRTALRHLAVQAQAFTAVMDSVQPLVVAAAFAKALQSAAQSVLDLGITNDQILTYAVNMRDGQAVLHDLDSMRAPDSPEGLT